MFIIRAPNIKPPLMRSEMCSSVLGGLLPGMFHPPTEHDKPVKLLL